MALTENEKRPDKKEKPLTKVVIRRLPPTMTQEQFLNQVSPVPEYNYIYHVKGDMSLGENAFSRAYINFVCPDDVYSFKERFDNYVFVDSKGHEYPAVVEFAPFQKIPKKRGKSRMDPKCNSIEADSYYLEFVTNLNKPIEQDAKPEYTLQLNERSDEKKDTTTPLLEYIKNKRAQRLKIREVRREERERRKKEFERKKEYGKYEGKYHDDRKYEEKSPMKPYGSKSQAPKSPKNESTNEKTKTETSDEKLEKSPKEKTWPEGKMREKKFEERRERKEIKPRFPKKDYTDKREDYSHREFRSKHYDEYKKEDSRTYPKKVKKYSEKREERKIEAQKAEQRKLEQQANESKEVPITNEESSSKIPKEKVENLSSEKLQSAKHPVNEENDASPIKSQETGEETKVEKKNTYSEKEMEKEDKKKDSDEKGESSSSRRIRNKDRPTIALYRPGMLSKKKQNETDDVSKPETKPEAKKE